MTSNPPGQDHYRRPESVLVVVYTRDGQTLLLRRADQPALWQSVTGSLQPDESPASAARRELAEETGLRFRPAASSVTRRFRILAHWKARYAPGTEWNLEHEFRLELPESLPVVTDPAEHLEHRWLPITEAASKVFSWTNREALEALS